MKRVLCLRLPNWPVQWRYAARPSDRARAIVVHASADRGKVRVVACCRAARKRGVKVGMLLAEAQSLWSGSAGSQVWFEQHDPHGDRQKLRELAGWAGQFSPWVAVDDAESPDCLLIDVTGCDYFAGGEAELAGQAVEGLKMSGYWAVAAVADTIGAVWAVAHFGVRRGSSVAVVPRGRHEETLRPLPVEALRLSPRVVEQLHEVKVTHIDQLLAIPRGQLPSRFGPDLLVYLDRALGQVPEALKPEQPADPLEGHWDFEPPVGDQHTLLAVFEHLLERLLKKIPRDRLGVHRMLCSLNLADHDPVHFPVELLRPTALQRALMDLVRLQLERVRIPGEIERVTVRVTAAAPLEYRQADLFGGKSDQGDEATRLLERLSSRLGERAVLRPQLVPDAQPELAYQYESWLAATRRLGGAERETPARRRVRRTPPTPGAMPTALRGHAEVRTSGVHMPTQSRGHGTHWDRASASRLTRPVVLMHPAQVEVVSVFPGGSPRRIYWNDRDHLVERSWGPERIETGWWRGGDVRRDYFAVEVASGERFWLFRDLVDGSWFLHGVFA